MGSRTHFLQLKRWFGSGKRHRYKRLARVYAQHLIAAMAHNLYPSLGRIMMLFIKINIINQLKINNFRIQYKRLNIHILQRSLSMRLNKLNSP
ncbi:MAG: hypothetical protein ACMUEL_09180 [Flavobacteriales bacterium Tduv]